MSARVLILWAAAALALAASEARAETAREAPSDGAGAHDWTLTLQVENEFFIPGRNDDRYYTQGLQLNLLTPSSRTPLRKLAQAVPELWDPADKFLDPDAQVRGSFVLGQNIYTPEDLTLEEPDPNDRPYAGWIYLGADVIAFSGRRLDALQLQVGLVGPSALGGWAQNNWHKHVFHLPEAKGWSYQLRDEVAFVLYGERRMRSAPVELGALSTDVTRNVNFALGTVQTSIGAGGMLRVGTGLEDDFGPARIRPAPIGSSFFRGAPGIGGYAYVGADAKVVGRDIFLDGNTFQDSRRVDKRHLVGELQAGAVLRIDHLRLTYAQVWRSEEFIGQRGPSHFASLTVGFYRPFGFLRPSR